MARQPQSQYVEVGEFLKIHSLIKKIIQNYRGYMDDNYNSYDRESVKVCKNYSLFVFISKTFSISEQRCLQSRVSFKSEHGEESGNEARVQSSNSRLFLSKEVSLGGHYEHQQ